MQSNVDQLDQRIRTHGGNAAVLSIALMGALLTFGPLALGFRPSDVVLLAAFALGFISMLWTPQLRSLPLGPRILLILFALRPLLDAAQSQDSRRTTLPLQNLFAFATAALLVLLWRKRELFHFLARAPNCYVVALIALTVLAWGMGGLGSGANGFLRTSWGLLFALLLGPLFRTKKQIDIFI